MCDVENKDAKEIDEEWVCPEHGPFTPNYVKNSFPSQADCPVCGLHIFSSIDMKNWEMILYLKPRNDGGI